MSNRGKLQWKTRIWFLTLLWVALLTLLGVSLNETVFNKNGKNERVVNGSKANPLKLTMVNQFVSKEAPTANTKIIRLIQQHTNTSLAIQWKSAEGYSNKVDALISSGDMPNILMVIQNKSPAVVNAVLDGAFWELGPYLKDYPNLNTKLNPVVLESVKYEGKLYSLPRHREFVREGGAYRKDWADNLKLNPPQTIEDLYHMIKAFTRDDPDKNGKNDTLGFVESKELRGFNFFAGVFGAPNQWGEQDGRLMPSHFTLEYLEALRFYKRLFDEDLMNKDFGVINQTQAENMIRNGNAGMLSTDPENIRQLLAELTKVSPDAFMEPFVKLHGPLGERVLMREGWTGMYFIPKASVKTEQDLRKVLKFFDELSDVDMTNLFVWGAKDVHYSLLNGKAIRTKEQTDLYAKEIWPRHQEIKLVHPSKATLLGETKDPFMNKVTEDKLDMESKMVPNPAQSIITRTESEKGDELAKLIEDARIKFIMGKIDESGWQQELTKWRSSGGDQLIEEINDNYNKLKKENINNELVQGGEH